MASNEMYSENDKLLDIDGTMHYLSTQDGVEAYRPCPPELAALILDNQHSQYSAVDDDVLLSDEKVDQKEKRHLSPKVVRGLVKIAVAGVVLGGAHMGANYVTTETLSMGNVSMNVGQLIGDVWADVTLPARVVVGR